MMATPFEKQQSPSISLKDRIAGSGGAKAALVIINNLLAEAERVSDVPPEAVEQALNMANPRHLAEGLQTIYTHYLEYCLIDTVLDERELLELRHLKLLTGLGDSTVASLHERVAKKLYKQSLEAALDDNRLDEHEKVFLKGLMERLSLPDSVAKAIYRETVSTHLQRVLDEALDDGMLSPDEEQELDALARSLNVTIGHDERSLRVLDEARLVWRLKEGDLPTLPVAINLQRNEDCYFMTSAQWLETRKVTQRVNYSGPSMRVKIAKGLYYNVGSYDRKSVSKDVLTPIDNGTLYLTNKRLLFVGKKGSKNIRLNRVLDFVPYANGVEIQKDAGKNPVLVFEPHVDIFSIVLARVLSDLHT